MLDCGLQTMQAINFLSRSVQVLSNRGLTADVTLLQAIYSNCAKLYKSVQCHLTHTKTKSDGSCAINVLTLRRNIVPKSTQFSHWLCSLESTLDRAISFYGLIPFIYMVREAEDHKAHAVLSSGIKLYGRCRVVLRLDGKHFNADICRFYTSLRVDVSSCGIGYFDKCEKNKYGRAAWKYPVEYYC